MTKLTQQLEEIAITQDLLDSVYIQNLISLDAKIYAMTLLNPKKQWGLWIARFLTSFGFALLFSGVVYFYAFNWFKITDAIKLASVELILILSLIATFFAGLETNSGKCFLLATSILTGVFLAVFGQVYQTGADAYQLFFFWALLILVWTLLSNFAASWLLWIIIANVTLLLYWNQPAHPTEKMSDMIYIYQAGLNIFFLFLREAFVTRNFIWLYRNWTRWVLVLSIIIILFIPAMLFIIDDKIATPSIKIGCFATFLTYSLFYYIYRYHLKDLFVISSTTVSTFILTEVFAIRSLDKLLPHKETLTWLLMLIITLVLFYFLISWLRKIAQSMEVTHV